MSHIVRYVRRDFTLFLRNCERPLRRGAGPRAGAHWRRVLTVSLLCATSQTAFADEIYKCVDASGRVTYQASACRNGSVVDIAAGTFDAAAAARLRDDAAAWNVRDDLRRAAAARDAAANAQRQQQMDAAADARAAAAAAKAGADSDSAGCMYCGAWSAAAPWPHPPWAQRPRPMRPRPPVPIPYRIVVR